MMKPEPPLEQPATGDARPPEQTWRILFLDSEDHNLLLKAACKEFGYAVVGANNIAEAWLFLDRKDHVDVIVCGAHLEQESMFEFLAGVRNHDVLRSAAFMILSLEPGPLGARVDGSTAAAALALGADAYWQMTTFDPVELVAMIKKIQPRIPVLQQDPVTKVDE